MISLFGPIATVAAMLLLFCLVTSPTQKAFKLPLSMGQFNNVTFHYHIVNSGFGNSEIFNMNFLVKLAVANMMIWCFILRGTFLTQTQHDL